MINLTEQHQLKPDFCDRQTDTYNMEELRVRVREAGLRYFVALHAGHQKIGWQIR